MSSAAAACIVFRRSRTPALQSRPSETGGEPLRARLNPLKFQGSHHPAPYGARDNTSGNVRIVRRFLEGHRPLCPIIRRLADTKKEACSPPGNP
jgi:hypothetical protein